MIGVLREKHGARAPAVSPAAGEKVYFLPRKGHSMKRKNTIITVLVSNTYLVTRDFLEQLMRLGTVNHYSAWDTLDLCQVLAETDILVTGWGSPLLPDNFPKKNKRLKYICHVTGEMKKTIRPSYIGSRIAVTNWGSSIAFATAEGAIALLFSVLKQIPALYHSVVNPDVPFEVTRPVMSLHGMRVGIYGLGFIGQLVAKMLRPFSPCFSFYDPTIKKAPRGMKQHHSMHDLFKNNDIVTVHAGLNDATRGSVTYEKLSLMPQGGVFINTARGPIVVEKDLARILREKRLYAGIDVIENERDWLKSPLAKCSNAILTGHCIASTGKIGQQVIQQTALENIRAFIHGKPLKYVIDRERYRLMT